jgi:hypothetical protein
MGPEDPLLLLGIGAVGLGLWRALLSGRVRPLDAPEDDRPQLLALFLAAWLGAQLVTAMVVANRGGVPEDLDGLLALQAGSNLVSVVLVLALARWVRGGNRALGLVPRRPLLDAPAAVVTWLAVLPVLAACAWLNQAALDWLGLPTGVQDHLERFLADGGAEAPWPWVAMVLVIPACEELVFRGAFYGGLRRLVPPWSAMLLSGLVFGAAHDPRVIVPVAAFGVALAWLYERTGSLLAPTLLHGIQNLSTLLIATLAPESLP